MAEFLALYVTFAGALFLMMLFPPTLAWQLEKNLAFGRCESRRFEFYVIMAIVALFWPVVLVRSFFK